MSEHIMADSGAPGSYSNSAITSLHAGQPLPASKDEQILAAKISRAMSSGPLHITRDATVAEMDAQGNLVVLRQGTNHWVCFPGDENEIGNVPMCADHMGLQWMMDIMSGKPAPTNTAPGIIYMLCGATQHSNTRSVRQNKSCRSHRPALDDHLAIRRGARRPPEHRTRRRRVGDVRRDALRIFAYLRYALGGP